MALALNKPISDEWMNSQIEALRHKLVKLVDEFGFAHPKVQACSEELDDLLILFYAKRISGYGHTDNLDNCIQYGKS